MATASAQHLTPPGAADALEAEAFQKLYPDLYLKRFLESDIRPDGRTLGKPRPTTITRGVVGTASSSVLVKFGNTTALAGIKLEVAIPSDEEPDKGRVVVAVEAPPLCHPDVRPGLPPEMANVASEHVQRCLEAAGCINRIELCIEPRQAMWVAYLDIYILDADGSTCDAALTAAVGALELLELPAVKVDETGNVVRSTEGTSAGRRLSVGGRPASVTCGMFQGKLLVDLSGEEEEVAEAVVTCCVDDAGNVLRMSMPGGTCGMDMVTAAALVEVAKTRQREIAQLMG